jgi:hypothetical protein
MSEFPLKYELIKYFVTNDPGASVAYRANDVNILQFTNTRIDSPLRCWRRDEERDRDDIANRDGEHFVSHDLAKGIDMKLYPMYTLDKLNHLINRKEVDALGIFIDSTLMGAGLA